MNTSDKDVLSQLEDAFESWNDQVRDSYRQLVEHVARSRGDLSTVVDSVKNGAGALRSELEARDVALERAEETIKSLEQTLSELDRQAAEHEQMLQRVEHEYQTKLDAANAELNTARDQLSQSLASAGKSEELLMEVAAERERADLLETLLRDAHPVVHRDEAAGEMEPIPQAEATGFSAFDEKGRRKRLGEILVDAGMLDAGELDTLLAEQTDNRQERLGAMLVEKGIIPAETVSQLLASQLRIPFMRLGKGAVDPIAASMVTPRLARQHTCLPIRLVGGRLVVAMANPFDLIAIEDIEKATSRTVEPVVATSDDITAAIETFCTDDA